MTGPMAANVAVFIDGENIPATMFDEISIQADKLGECLIWRVFGDFSLDSHADWLAVCRRHGIQAFTELPTESGKNSTDIAIVIAAMDLLATSTIDALVLVSDDRDFLPLVRRLRAGGMDVHGLGRKSLSMDLRRYHSSWTQLPAKPIAKIAASKIEVHHPEPVVKAVTRTAKPPSPVPQKQKTEKDSAKKGELKRLVLGKLKESSVHLSQLNEWIKDHHEGFAHLSGKGKLKKLLDKDEDKRFKFDGQIVSLIK